MEELIMKYISEITSLKERINTALFIGSNQQIRIETNIEVLERVIKDLNTMRRS